MGQLLDLNDNPIAWSAIHQRNEAYWAARKEVERFETVTFLRRRSPSGRWQLVRPVVSA